MGAAPSVEPIEEVEAEEKLKVEFKGVTMEDMEKRCGELEAKQKQLMDAVDRLEEKIKGFLPDNYDYPLPYDMETVK